MKPIRWSAAIWILVCFNSHRCLGQSIQPSPPTNDQYDFIESGNALQWIGNNGAMSWNPKASGNGFIWPKGSGKSVIFQDGVLYAGKIGDSLHVGGSTYRTGLQAGPLLPSGLPSDPDDEKYRIYKVRKLNRMVFDTMNVTMRNRFGRIFSNGLRMMVLRSLTQMETGSTIRTSMSGLPTQPNPTSPGSSVMKSHGS